IDVQGVIRGFKIVDHNEPIGLIGIPEAKVIASLNTLIGKDITRVSSGSERPPQVDIVSGATVTVLVMGDSIVRSAVQIIRNNRLGGADVAMVSPPIEEVRTVDLSKSDIRDWET